MKILLTSTSFHDTPGKHHDLLNKQGFDIDVLRGPIYEDALLPIIENYDVDKIDLKAAKKYKIPVTNCPGVNQVSVAEHVLALLFSFEKNIHLQYNSTKEGSWKRLTGNEIQGKTLGIVGLGAIGKELGKKAIALGMHVLAYDIHKDEDYLKKNAEITFVDSLNQVYAESDVISLHVPHTPSTEMMINKSVIFNKLKRTPIIINTSRGKLVDAKAVIEGLSENKLKGYLTDVLAQEPMTSNEAFKGVNNVIITPHVGSRTYQSVQRQGLMAVNNLLNLIKGEN